jgi:hypothetical protein
MKWFVSALFVIAWALWFGGAVATLLFVQRLFHDDRGLALLAAPKLFLTFEKYQILLAAIVVVSLAGMGGRRRYTALVVLVLIAAVTACGSAFVVTPRIEYLRIAGEEHSAAFRTLHGLSMVIYLVVVLLLLAVGILLAQPAAESRSHGRN